MTPKGKRMHKRYPTHNGTMPVSPPLGFYTPVLFLLISMPWVILSVGAVNALIPIMIIIILIAAAAGSTRNFSFFNVFGISQLLSGLGSYGGGSRGSMAKSGYSMRAYLDPFIRYTAKNRNKGGNGDFEKARVNSLKKILTEARVVRGGGPNKGGVPPSPGGKGGIPPGSGRNGTVSPSQGPKANILIPPTVLGAVGSTIKGTATRLRLMKGPAAAQNRTQGSSDTTSKTSGNLGKETAKTSEKKDKEIEVSPIGMPKFLAPFRWGLAKSIQDQYRAYRPKISEPETYPTPRPVKEQMALMTLLFGAEGTTIKSRQESINEKKAQLEKLEDEYSKKYKASDITMVFTPALGKVIDPLRLVSSNQRQNSREAWKMHNEILQLSSQIRIEEIQAAKGKPDNLYTGHIENALDELKTAKETYKTELQEAKKLNDKNKYMELQTQATKVDTMIAQGNNLLNIAPLMRDSVQKRLALIERYTGTLQAETQQVSTAQTESTQAMPVQTKTSHIEKPDMATSQIHQAPAVKPGAYSAPAEQGIISDLKDRYDKGEITGKQFDREYVRVYNQLYGPVDKSVMHHISNRFYSNYLLGMVRTSDKPSGYAELVSNFVEGVPAIVKNAKEISSSKKK